MKTLGLRLERARLVLVGAARRDVRRAVVVERFAHAGARCESYIPHSSRSTLQISPIVQRARSASRIGGSMFSSPRAASRTRASAASRVVGVALRAHPRRPLELAALGLGVEPVQLDRLLVVLVEAVDADDHALARLDLLLVAERRLLDLVLDEALLDRRDRAAELVDALDQLRARAARARR